MNAHMQEIVDSAGEVVVPVALGEHFAYAKYPESQEASSVEFMLKDLARSGLTPADLPCYPISAAHYGVPGYVMPNPHNASSWEIRLNRKTAKYLSAKNVKDIYIPQGLTVSALRLSTDIWAIEGAKKAVKFQKENPLKLVIGFPGAWNLQKDNRLLPKLVEILKPGTRLHLMLDGDIRNKAGIQQAATYYIRELKAIHVDCILYMPKEGYKGIDDQLLAEPDSSHELEIIKIEDLEQSRNRLYLSLGCSLGDNGTKLFLNANNAKLILQDLFEARLENDRRLGYLFDGVPVNIDQLTAIAGHYVQTNINAMYSVSSIKEGLAWALASLPQTDRIRDLILDTPWDGVERLNTWAEDYLPCVFQKHANDVARIFMTGWGLRLLRPGTKHDTVFGLVGPQGLLKSTFWEDLATFEGQRYYTTLEDVPKTDGDKSRTVAALLESAALADLAEGVVQMRARRQDTQGLLKQFLTEREDRFRKPYAKSPITVPRGYSFVGTANTRPSHNDRTGTRRYDYIEPTSIKLIPYHIKLQLLAEVAAKENQLRNSKWYELTLTREDLLPEMLEGNEHIENVHEILNQAYTAPDPLGESILQALAEGVVPWHDDTKRFVLTATHLVYLCGEEMGISSAQRLGGLMRGLESSATFPYLIKHKKISVSMLRGLGKDQSAFYRAVAGNQCWVYEFTPRESIPLAPKASQTKPESSTENIVEGAS